MGCCRSSGALGETTPSHSRVGGDGGLSDDDDDEDEEEEEEEEKTTMSQGWLS
jgi:hypothetical protein